MRELKEQEFYYRDQGLWKSIYAENFIDAAKKLSKHVVENNEDINFKEGFIFQDVLMKDKSGNMRVMSAHGRRCYIVEVIDNS